MDIPYITFATFLSFYLYKNESHIECTTVKVNSVALDGKDVSLQLHQL